MINIGLDETLEIGTLVWNKLSNDYLVVIDVLDDGEDMLMYVVYTTNGLIRHILHINLYSNYAVIVAKLL